MINHVVSGSSVNKVMDVISVMDKGEIIIKANYIQRFHIHISIREDFGDRMSQH